MTIYKLSRKTRFYDTTWFEEDWFQYFANFSDAEKVKQVLDTQIPNDNKNNVKYVIEAVVSADEKA